MLGEWEATRRATKEKYAAVVDYGCLQVGTSSTWKKAFFCDCINLLFQQSCWVQYILRFLTELARVILTQLKVGSIMSSNLSAIPTSITSVSPGFSFSLFSLSHLTTTARQQIRTSTMSPGDLAKDICIGVSSHIDDSQPYNYGLFVLLTLDKN